MITVKGIIYEDTVNYKKISMTIMCPYCTFKCGKDLCQNSDLALSKNILLDENKLIEQYISNPLTEAICFQGLDPLDGFDEVVNFIDVLRHKYNCKDDVVIYTGYNENECQDKINILQSFENIIVKFGRFIPNQKPHYDNILGVNLISDNQYGVRL